MPVVKISCSDPGAVVRRAFYLAWRACGGPLGWGIFQDNPSATEADVWDNVSLRGDYPAHADGTPVAGPGVKPGEAYGDYVFGRMMKLGLRWDDTGVLADDAARPRPDYQSWCTTYPTYEALVRAAAGSLEKQPA